MKKKGGTTNPDKMQPMKPDNNIRPKQIDPPEPIQVKMAKFRCVNDACPAFGDIRDDIPESQAKTFTECPDCSANVVRLDVYECAKCAKIIIVLYDEPRPETCACGHTKLVLK
jgi:hypothetical protein